MNLLAALSQSFDHEFSGGFAFEPGLYVGGVFRCALAELLGPFGRLPGEADDDLDR